MSLAAAVVARTARKALGSVLRHSARPVATPAIASVAPAFAIIRLSSYTPMTAASTDGKQRKKTTISTLRSLYKKKEPIAAITAYDFPSGLAADTAGIDLVLVGDSLAMVGLGMDDTSEVLVEEMLLHCRSVMRACKSCFVVGDMPMGSYEISPEQALETAIRFIKVGRVNAVKLEGGREMAPIIHKITQNGGIPVLAHIGLTPQRQNALGGFRVQGKTARGALDVLKDALAVQEAGAFAVVLEAVPAEIGRIVTEALDIPTLGVGAGNACSGQILVQVDVTGNFPPGRFLPKFVKKYGDVYSESLRALETYRADIKTRTFPATEHTYPIAQEELDNLARAIEESGLTEKK